MINDANNNDILLKPILNKQEMASNNNNNNNTNNPNKNATNNLNERKLNIKTDEDNNNNVADRDTPQSNNSNNPTPPRSNSPVPLSSSSNLPASPSRSSMNRKHLVSQFLKSGESNQSFANKAPSIVQSSNMIPIMHTTSSPKNFSSRASPNIKVNTNQNNNNNATTTTTGLFIGTNSPKPTASPYGSAPNSPRSGSVSSKSNNKVVRRKKGRGNINNSNNNTMHSGMSTNSPRATSKQHQISLISPFLEERDAEDYITYDYTEHAEHHLHVIDNREIQYGNKVDRLAKSASTLERETRRAKRREQLKQDKLLRKSLIAHAKIGYDSERDDSDAGSHMGTSDEEESTNPNNKNDKDDDEDDINPNDISSVSQTYRSCSDRLFQYRIVKFLYRIFLMSQGWVLCGLIGVTTGVIASFVDLATQWAVDIKSGYCNQNWYLPNSMCCAGSTANIANAANRHPLLMECDEWTQWTTLMSPSIDAYVSGYIIYVIFAVSMSAMAAYLIQAYSKHAAGSGIPEVKTILGGVIIKRYLGITTLITKSLGLILVVGAGLSAGKGKYIITNLNCSLFPKYIFFFMMINR
jgi:hypothetical protein